MSIPVNDTLSPRNGGNFPVVDGPIKVRSMALGSFPAASSLPAGTMLEASDQGNALYMTDGASTWSKVVLGTGAGIYGDGSDGDVVLTGNLDLAHGVKYYNSLDTNGHDILNAAGGFIHCKGKVWIRAGSTIHAEGQDAQPSGFGGQPVGGTGGGDSGSFPTVSSVGKRFGCGGPGASGNGVGGPTTLRNSARGIPIGGAGGGVTGHGGGTGRNPPDPAPRYSPESVVGFRSVPSEDSNDPVLGNFPRVDVFCGGGGGMGGSNSEGTGTYNGGGGGGGGGVFGIAAPEIQNDGLIKATGGKGGDSDDDFVSTGDGGGGGGGGAVLLTTPNYHGTGSVDVSPGAGGAPASSGGNAGLAGQPGQFVVVPA